MSLPEAVLTWSKITKSYGRRTLFKDLNGDLVSGQSLVVTGSNGAGKSTFLRIAAGLLSPDRGEFARPNPGLIGYCSPALELYADLTGAENLLFFSRITSSERFDHATLLSEFGLERAKDKLYASYSSGMKQRLKLAFAVLQEPSLLILDEPTLALDSEGVAIVDHLITRHLERGGAALIASNAHAEVERWGTATLHIGSEA